MKTKHTPEPWNVHEHDADTEPMRVEREDGSEFLDMQIKIAKGEKIIGYLVMRIPAEGWVHVDNVDECRANLQRIIACVNNCRGINPGAVPQLMAACEAAANDVTHAQSQCRAAVAEAKS